MDFSKLLSDRNLLLGVLAGGAAGYLLPGKGKGTMGRAAIGGVVGGVAGRFLGQRMSPGTPAAPTLASKAAEIRRAIEMTRTQEGLDARDRRELISSFEQDLEDLAR